MTDYIETNALLAVMNGDLDEAVRLVEDLLPGERARFATQLGTLTSLVCSVCCECKRVIRDRGDLVVTGLIGRDQYHSDCYDAWKARTS